MFHNLGVSLLQVQNLHVRIEKAEILRGVDLSVERGQTIGVVGESGCGKSMTGLALIGMLPPKSVITSGNILLQGKDITHIRESEWRAIRGKDVAMVMQDPFTSLNPLMRVGDQIAEVYLIHRSITKREARKLAIEMIEKVGVPEPEASSRKYPHQMSGGQRQRIVIAIAMAAKPALLIADEPTTALDVTLQAQILHLLKDLQKETQMGLVLISHDIGVIAAMSDEIAVYYAGRVVETGVAREILKSPSHPYTQALLDAVPAIGRDRLAAIEGHPPDLTNLQPGCSFAPRCKFSHERCVVDPPLINVSDSQAAACWLRDSETPSPVAASEEA